MGIVVVDEPMFEIRYSRRRRNINKPTYTHTQTAGADLTVSSTIIDTHTGARALTHTTPPATFNDTR